MHTHLKLGAALMVGALLASGTFSVASADTQVRVRLDWVAYGLHAPFFVGIEKGWFEEKGLDVSVKDGNGSSKTITLVAAGEYDIGHANLSAMVLAHNKGLPVISVGHIVRKSDVAVIVPNDSGIETPKDLEGKRVAMTPGGFTDPFFDTLLKAGGTSRDKLTVVGVTGKVKTSTYVSGNADAMLSTAPYYLPVLVDKRPSRAMLFADYGIPLPGFGLVANQRFVSENEQATSDFVQIFFRALAWIYDGNKAEAVEIFQKHRPEQKNQASANRKSAARWAKAVSSGLPAKDLSFGRKHRPESRSAGIPRRAGQIGPRRSCVNCRTASTGSHQGHRSNAA